MCLVPPRNPAVPPSSPATRRSIRNPPVAFVIANGVGLLGSCASWHAFRLGRGFVSSYSPCVIHTILSCQYKVYRSLLLTAVGIFLVVVDLLDRRLVARKFFFFFFPSFFFFSFFARAVNFSRLPRRGAHRVGSVLSLGSGGGKRIGGLPTPHALDCCEIG